jgi:hypothetical protein
VVLRQFVDRLLDHLPQVAPAIQIIRPVRVVLPLQRAVVGVPVLLDRLEQDQRVPRAVAQLVLGQVARDRVRPRRELLRLVEPMQMPVYANERFLNQILRAVPVPDRAVNEVQEPDVVSLRQFRERALFAVKE